MGTIEKIKEKIESTFIGEYLVSVLHCVECKIVPFFVDDETAVKRYYKKRTGKDLDLDNPQTFSEKLNWYKLNGRDPLMQKCADKLEVREYVKSKGYGDCLNDLLAVYDKVNQIKVDDLPEKFVLKASHGSHMNLIVKDKSKINWFKEKLMMSTWLHQDIAWSGREWVYKDMPKRIIAEKYLEDESGELRDYKFFCFNGKPTYLQVDMGRFEGTHYRNYYDMDLNLIKVSDDCKRNDDVLMPIDDNNFKKMKSMAEDFSKDFQFVRVDFYLVKNKIYFGELTFFHNGGITWFNPEKYDLIFGEKWDLKEI